jgi:hypothetical protein
MKEESLVIANQHVAVNSSQLHDTPPVTPWKLVLVETKFCVESKPIFYVLCIVVLCGCFLFIFVRLKLRTGVKS